MHIFPEAFFRAIWDWFNRHAWPIKNRLPADQLIDLQWQCGARGLVLLTYAHKPGVSGFLNQFLAQIVARHPGTIGLGTVHPDDPNPRDILRQAFDSGLAGCKLHCHVMGRAMDQPAFSPIYEACLEHDRWLVVHAGTQPALEAYGLDVTAISGVERVRRVLARYPELKLIVPHLGFDQTERFMDLLDTYPHLYLDTAMVLADYFRVKVERPWLIQHSRRILYGSDFPNIPYGLTREVEHILSLGLGERATADILGGNAARLFGLANSRP